MLSGLEVLSRHEREGAREYALRLLKYNIVRLHLKPGTMISAADLAEVTGISRTPFREALQELAGSGVMEIFPQAGSRVSFIDYEKIHEVRLIRLSLEAAVTRLACERMGPKECAMLESLLQAQQTCMDRRDVDGLLDMDDAFHRYIYEMTGKLFTYRVVEAVQVHFDRVRRMSLDSVAGLRVVSDHEAYYQAMRRGDKVEAVRLLEEHLSRYLEDAPTLRAAYPEYFA